MESIYKYSLKREHVLEFRESEKICSAADVFSFYQQNITLENPEQEHFFVLFLNAKNNVTGYTLITMGLIDRSLVHPREVFRAAILQGCSRIILLHNHPSNNLTPSKEDLATTKRLQKAAKIIGIDILDHLIVSDTTFYSFSENVQL